MGFGDSDHVLSRIDIWLQDYAVEAPVMPIYSQEYLRICEYLGLEPLTLLVDEMCSPN